MKKRFYETAYEDFPCTVCKQGNCAVAGDKFFPALKDPQNHDHKEAVQAAASDGCLYFVE